MGCSFIWATNRKNPLSNYEVIRMAQKTQKGPWGPRVIQIKKNLFILFEEIGCSFIWAMNHKNPLSNNKVLGVIRMAQKNQKGPWGPRVVQISKKLFILFEEMGCSFIWAMNHKNPLSNYKVIRVFVKKCYNGRTDNFRIFDQ